MSNPDRHRYGKTVRIIVTVALLACFGGVVFMLIDHPGVATPILEN